MSIYFQKSGILTTFQDLGRTGYRRFGINPNGAMDKSAIRLINILLENDENEAVLEFHFPAAEIKFERPAVIAIGGADFCAKVDGIPVANWRRKQIDEGQTLRFLQRRSGNRTYLSVKGGFALEKWLASASANLQANVGAFDGRKLENGDRALFNEINQTESDSKKLSREIIPAYSDNPTIRMIAGPESKFLTGISEEILFREQFTITTDSNRMGFRLAGKPLYLLDKVELVSSAVDFGTIQLLPDGQIIILMADHQTTGGYPRIGNVASADLPLLAQLGANDQIRFELISYDEAEDLVLKFERDLKFLRAGISFETI